jgi:hypothetical protein
VHIPYDSSGIGGATYHVKEYKGGGLLGPKKEYTDFEIKGVVDESGYAYVKFYPKKNTKYQYEITMNFDNLKVPFENYTVVNPPIFDLISREDFGQKTRDYNVKVLPIMNIIFHYENLNCVNSSDEFKFNLINLDERFNPNVDIDDLTLFSFPFSLGCTNYTYTSYRKAGRYLLKWEAEKGGLITSGVDTFFVAPGVNDEINIFW